MLLRVAGSVVVILSGCFGGVVEDSLTLMADEIIASSDSQDPSAQLALAGTAQEERNVRVYKTVEGRSLKLYLTNPTDLRPTDRRPAIVFFHGGGWTGGKPTQFDEQAEYLASRGIVCVQVQYRLLSKKNDDPPLICVQDAKSAMRWVRSHASELGIDPQRIGAGGGSAGGHLAAFVGLVDGQDSPDDDMSVSPKAAALLLFNPVFDNGHDGGWGTKRVGDRYPEFSPAHNITPDDPPAIVFIGTEDKLNSVATVKRFQSRMHAASVRCEVSVHDGQNHGFFNQEPFKTKTLIETDRFLTSLGWLEGPPQISSEN